MAISGPSFLSRNDSRPASITGCVMPIYAVMEALIQWADSEIRSEGTGRPLHNRIF